MAGTYTKLYYHIVFSTKKRRRYITPAIENDLYQYIAGIIRGLEGSCIAVNGIEDHIRVRREVSLGLKHYSSCHEVSPLRG